MAVVTDTIADMLTRIRNANQMRYEEVKVPASNIKKEIARILKEEGFINDYKLVKDDVQGTLLLTLKYTDKRERVQTSEILASQLYTKDCIQTLIDTFNYDAKVGGLSIRLKGNTAVLDAIELEQENDNKEVEQ